MKILLVGGSQFMWNLSANVGLSSPNNQDDVEFVQLALTQMARRGSFDSAPAVKTACGRIVLGQSCTGRRGDGLVDAIIELQRAAKRGVQDGHVSVINNPSGTYTERGITAAFLMAFLNNNLSDLVPDKYPRLDGIPECPQNLKVSVKRLLVR